MSKEKRQYQCNTCGSLHPKWVGQCADCGAWNTLEEVVTDNLPSFHTHLAESGENRGTVQALSDVILGEEIRTKCGFTEFDRVLGGGLVPGAVILLGGDPGIGKSTILLQILAAIHQLDSLYISGEESNQQIKIRAQRLGLRQSRQRLLTETCVERILATARVENPKIMVIDSIQTLYTERLPAAPGSVSQVRESAAQLVRYAKHTNTDVFLIGHVTKEGSLAGPRILEHMVDTVLYFEGNPGSRYRVLRAVKNRFGAVNELGVFAMTESGLRGVSNPSAIFLSRHEKPVPGSTIMVTLEGTRPLLVEIQALVDESHLASPRRVAIGLDQSRLAMLLAVLHKHGGIAMHDQDVFLNAVGGVKITETGVDLAVLLAVLSSFRNIPLPPDWVVFGEIGLAGEIRPVINGQERLKEAAKHGFKHAIIAQANAPKKLDFEMELTAVNRLIEIIDRLQAI